ncbi:MAG TPA: SCO family protein [Ramlibacter sp.]|nr:SCO family protein [Ramlibacter sp.]
MSPRIPRQLPGIAAAMLGLVLALLPATLRAQQSAAPALDQTEAIRASQAVIGQPIGDYELLNRDGQPVRLASFRGKPLLVSFIYTGCFQVCPTTTRSLDETVRSLQGRFGDNLFNVVSIGFNQPADSPQALKAFAAQLRLSRPNWDFLSPPAAVVGPLTRDFGFRYEATPAGFDHVLQVTLVDAQGRIARQVYGDKPAADEIGEPLKQMLSGAPLPPQTKLADLIDRVRLLCTVYDPKTGSYRVDYSLAIEIAGGLTFILAMALYMLNEWLERRKARRGRGTPEGRTA